MAKRFTQETAVNAALNAGAQPLEPYPGNMAAKWMCECLMCGVTVYPRMGSIERGSKACRYCYGSNTTPIEVSRQAKKNKIEQQVLKAKAQQTLALAAMGFP